MSVSKGQTLYRSVLSWGGPGSGKTAFGVSSFWDYLKEEPVEGRTGRLLLIGRESNPDLGVPEALIKRFAMNPGDPLGFVQRLITYLETLVASARSKKEDIVAAHPRNIVIDGMSELSIDYLWAYTEENEKARGTWEPYNELKRDLTQLMLLLDPVSLGANLFATARVSKFKKAGQTRGGKEIEGDPEWMSEFTYHPAIDGFWRDNLGHYFNHIVYHEATYKDAVKSGKAVKVPQFLSHWLPTGPYVVKNTASHKWPLDATLTNATWLQIEQALRGGEDA